MGVGVLEGETVGEELEVPLKVPLLDGDTVGERVLEGDTVGDKLGEPLLVALGVTLFDAV